MSESSPVLHRLAAQHNVLISLTNIAGALKHASPAPGCLEQTVIRCLECSFATVYDSDHRAGPREETRSNDGFSCAQHQYNCILPDGYGPLKFAFAPFVFEDVLCLPVNIEAVEVDGADIDGRNFCKTFDACMRLMQQAICTAIMKEVGSSVSEDVDVNKLFLSLHGVSFTVSTVVLAAEKAALLLPLYPHRILWRSPERVIASVALKDMGLNDGTWYVRDPNPLAYAVIPQECQRELLFLHRDESLIGAECTVVAGAIRFFHYKCDVDDGGWGCAYRTLQTMLSWCLFNGFIARVPSIHDIQQTLVDIGDKQQRFVGSSEWIGSVEASIMLRQVPGMDSLFRRFDSCAAVMRAKAELRKQFEMSGPMMLSCGAKSYTLAGIRGRAADELDFLVLDPHYVGDDNRPALLDRVTNLEGARGTAYSWRNISSFGEGPFSMCFYSPT